MANIKDILIKNKFIILIFVIFFIMVFIQHQFLYINHDDYAYASLSYAYNVEEVRGCEFNFSQLIEFLKGHYNVWGGRILGIFIEIVLINKGIWIFRLVQSIIITLIFFMIFLLVKKINSNQYISNEILAILTVSCYGFFEIMLFRNGFFWVSASVTYVFPILPLLIFIYYYQDSKEKKFRNIFTKVVFYIFNVVCVIMATFSHEQIAIATLTYILVLTIYNWVKNKKCDIKDVIMLIVSVIFFAILMCAPGNEIRQNHSTSIGFYSQPFFKRIIIGITNLILGEFSTYTRVFNCLFYLCVGFISYSIVKEKIGNKILSNISLHSIILIIVFTLFKQEGYFVYLYEMIPYSWYKICIIIIFVIQLIFMVYTVIIYLYNKEKIKLINILISALISQLCMIVAPYFALRSAIIFEMLCFILMLYVLIEICNMLKNKSLFYYIIIPMLLFSIINFFTITIGYYKNSNVNKENDKILKEISDKISNGENVNSVTLKKLPNILYSGDQPYINGCDYIKVFMKEYYNLPKDFEINYE